MSQIEKQSVELSCPANAKLKLHIMKYLAAERLNAVDAVLC